MAIAPLITPCLWFDSQAEDAARFYTAIFPHSKIGQITYYGSGPGDPRPPAGIGADRGF
ncbi:MAG: VOC family protein [Planctomycetaceae bacterium]